MGQRLKRVLGQTTALLAVGLSCAAAAEGSVGLRAPAGYVPGLPVLLRVELLRPDGRIDRAVWDSEAAIAVTQPGVALSTNRITLRNGMGSTLVTFTGGADIDATITVAGVTTSHHFAALDPQDATSVGGDLPGNATTWSGVISVTNDVVVPVGHVLTILPGTWVLMRGVASGTAGTQLRVNGEIQSLGSLEAPVVITCASAGMRWGQIRHTDAQPSSYNHTIITLAGRCPGEGHTGQGPAIRTFGSRIAFNQCSLTDHASPAGTPGKIMQASTSSITMTNCLLSRARMGPEIDNTALQFIDSYIIDMRGPDDADGIYLHSQSAGQEIQLAGCVVAGGDDDGIDTLGSNITVQDCIVRGWKFPGDDSKGISVLGGECRVWNCLLADNTIGLSGKGGNGENVRVRIDHSTIVGNSYGVAVTNKTGSTPIIDYRITNSIIVAPDAVFTQYDPADIHISYSLVGEEWPGPGILEGDPGFVDAAQSDFHLKPFSPCIDAGDPVSPMDADGSQAVLGCFTFVPPPPVLGGPPGFTGGKFTFDLTAYTNRNYVLETSSNGVDWAFWQRVFQVNETMPVSDPESAAAGNGQRLYRAHLSP